jgi:hypothetical protein
MRQVNGDLSVTGIGTNKSSDLFRKEICDEMKKHNLLKVSMAAMITAFALWTVPAGLSLAYTEATGTIVPASAKIRNSAGSSADVVGSAVKGTTVTIVDETKDDSGTVWYKVTVNGNTGYIRSDLVTKGAAAATDSKASDTKASDTKASDTKASDTKASDTKASDTKASDAKTSDAKASDTKASDTKAAAAKTAPAATATTIDGTAVDLTAVQLPDGVTGTDAQYVSVNVASGKIRSDASTNADLVDTLAKDSKLIAVGTKADSAGKSWYYTLFTGNDGSQKNGFIRSDLVTAGDVLQKQEESTEASTETAAESSAAPNSDYQLVYADDGSGTSAWYLYDNKNGTRMKADELMDYVTAQPAQEKANESQLKQYRMIIIILAVVTVAFLTGIIVLAVKLRGTEYEYDPDDEDDEDDEDRDGAQKPRRRGLFRHDEDDEDDDDDDEDDEDDRSVRRSRHAVNADNEDRHRQHDSVRPERRYEDDQRPRRPREDDRPVRRHDDDRRDARPDTRSDVRPVRRPREDERPVRRPDRDRGYEDDGQGSVQRRQRALRMNVRHVRRAGIHAQAIILMLQDSRKMQDRRPGKQRISFPMIRMIWILSS